MLPKMCRISVKCLSLEIGPCRCNQAKIKSLRWALVHYDYCPFKKREDVQVKTDTQGNGHMIRETEAEVRQGTPRLDSHHQKPGRGKEGPPYRF